jgi:Ser/Thr protein kinase RdoA (MazF antagonist)
VYRAADNLAGLGARLSGAVPMALDQNDLHVHNVFSSQPSAPFRFFDFGDAVWGHPFATLACVRAALADDEVPTPGRRTTRGSTSSPIRLFAPPPNQGSAVA